MKCKHIIFETDVFLIGVPEHPHIDRCDGGHIVVMSKIPCQHALTDLSIPQAHEIIELAKYCGAALKDVLVQNEVDVEMINYQINGNWSANNEIKDPLHLHIYGRARSSKHQKFGEALFFPNPQTGFYDNFAPISLDEAMKIRTFIINAINN